MTISFNLAPGAAIGEAVSGIQSIEKELYPPLPLQTSFQGNAQAFSASLKSTPILIAASLFAIYLILGMLYESFIHPITIISTLPSAGVGALLLLMAAHFDLSVIAVVGIILLIGIVKKTASRWSTSPFKPNRPTASHRSNRSTRHASSVSVPFS